MKLERIQLLRLWAKVNKLGPIGRHYRTGKSIGRCWEWIGGGSLGYGHVRLDGKVCKAHRVVYELLVGPITKPQLDHLCRNRKCVRPKHLEPVTSSENNRRRHAGAYWDGVRARECA